MTSAFIYHVLHFLNITIDIRNVCVFLAPLFSSLTTIVTYHLTKELKVSVYTACAQSVLVLVTISSVFVCLIGCRGWAGCRGDDCHRSGVHITFRGRVLR